MTTKATKAKSTKSTTSKTDKTRYKAETRPTTPAQANTGTDTQRKSSGTSKHYKPAQRDRFGLQVGSKVSRAAEMFAQESGCSMSTVTETVGGPQYNLLRFLERQGHKVVRRDGIITVLPKIQS